MTNKHWIMPWLRPFNPPYRNIPWSGGANWSPRYPEDDEGAHNGTWTYRKQLESTTGRHSNGVRAILHINSDFKRRRPRGYTLRVELDRRSVLVCSAACTSVRGALEHATQIDMYDAVHRLLHEVYNKARARCVFAADGTPLLSTFDDLYGWRDGLPTGHYYDIDPVSHYRERATHHTEMWGSGYCAGSIPNERKDFAATLVPWT